LNPQFFTPGAYGMAMEDIHSNFVDPSGNVYTYLQLPSIKSINNQIGSNNSGQVLNISGYGFTTDINKVSVLIGNKICNVISTDKENISCITTNKVDNNNISNVGNVGLRHRFWFNQSNWNNRYNIRKNIKPDLD